MPAQPSPPIPAVIPGTMRNGTRMAISSSDDVDQTAGHDDDFFCWLAFHELDGAFGSQRGGFDGRPLEKDTDEMVWTAWKD